MAERIPIERQCSRPDCHDYGHVLLFALGGNFDGLTYQPGQPVAFCLRHGGQAYDAIHAYDARRNGAKDWINLMAQVAPWLRSAGENLPTVRAAHHNPPGEVKPPRTWGARVGIPERPPSKPKAKR